LSGVEAPCPLSVAKTAPAYQHAQGWPLPGGVELWAPPGAFTQVNWQVNIELVKQVLAGVTDRGIRSFLDLYCGAGNFTLPLGRAGMTGVGVDSAESAIVQARKTASALGITEIEFLDRPAAVAMAEFIRSGRRFDCLLLDPPRVGGREVLALAVELQPRFLALCACDPVTLARDLALLGARGFLLEELTAFDMFPHTHHLETVAWLRRATGSLAACLTT
jgi:23S rRNA (uracil1939-C5)-methyltransferase